MDERIMTGTQAEQNLLGAIIRDPRQIDRIHRLVASGDFTDARMGVVFDGILERVSRRDAVDAAIVDVSLAGWGVRGLDTEPFTWADPTVYAFAAPEYARAVRSDAVRRESRNIANTMQEELAAGAVPMDAASQALNRLQALVDGHSTGLLQTKTLAEILAGSDAYDWVVPGLLERKDRLIVTGPEGSGKTTFVRQLAVLAAAGIHPTTFERIDPVQVLVVDAENTERQWRRAVRWSTRRARESGAVDPATAINIVAGNRIDITRGSHLSEIHRLIDRHKPDVLFIGPLYKLVPKAINNDDDAAPLIVGLDSLRERDIALVMEAHAGKSASASGERDLRPRGSAALLGWPEFGFGLRPDPDNVGDMKTVAVSRWRGDRDERGWPRRMVRGDSWPWEPVA
jgi:signal recognition particle receptor subunit beta